MFHGVACVLQVSDPGRANHDPMRDCWLIHPSEAARGRWLEALPELQARASLEDCPGARLVVLGDAAWLHEARSRAPGVPVVVITEADPLPLYAAGANSVIAEPQTPEQCRAVVEFWVTHNLA